MQRLRRAIEKQALKMTFLKSQQCSDKVQNQTYGQIRNKYSDTCQSLQASRTPAPNANAPTLTKQQETYLPKSNTDTESTS